MIRTRPIARLCTWSETLVTGTTPAIEFEGIAPNAYTINLQVLDHNGTGGFSSVIAAIQTYQSEVVQHPRYLPFAWPPAHESYRLAIVVA